MSATLHQNKLKVEAYGTVVTVPDNSFAKLMYYLDCVLTVIEYNRNSKLTDYKNYNNLNNEEEKLVIELALTLNPKLFIDAGIFILNPNLLPDSSDNKFYKITDETIGIHVNEEIFIGGRAVKVLNIMACNNSWIQRNYINPLKRINEEIKNRKLLAQQRYNTETGAIYVPIAVNQIVPTRNYNFGTSSIIINCQFCHQNVTTTTECGFSCASCCLCLCVGILFYACIQLCRGKSLLCENVTHKCPNCGRVVGEYNSC